MKAYGVYLEGIAERMEEISRAMAEYISGHEIDLSSATETEKALDGWGEDIKGLAASLQLIVSKASEEGVLQQAQRGAIPEKKGVC